MDIPWIGTRFANGVDVYVDVNDFYVLKNYCSYKGVTIR